MRSAITTQALIAVCWCCFSTGATGAELDVTYVKTLGQTNVIGTPLRGTGWKQLAVDPQGNICLAVDVGHPWTAIVKIGPNGRVIWETRCGGYALLPLTIADDYVYAVSPGFLLHRYSLSTGVHDKEWGYTFEGDKPDIKGVKKFESASGIAVVGKYLFVADQKAKLLRRFERATAAEKPLLAPPQIEEPLDIAAAKNGNLLVLTEKAVLEFDGEGKPIAPSLIGGLVGAKSLEVDPFTGEIFVAVGGSPGALVNRIRQFTAGGRATGVELGRGGDFNGPWSPDVFAFSSGMADFALDASGGIWVNNGLGQMSHFTSAPELRHDRTFTAIPAWASDLQADSDLNAYIALAHGGLKLGWDNQVKWTCGVFPSGNARKYPGSPLLGWPVYFAGWDGKNPVLYGLHANMIYSLDAATGELTRPVFKTRQPHLARVLVEQGEVLAAGTEAEKWQVDRALLSTPEKPELLFFPPPELKSSLLAVSPDRKLRFLWGNQSALCLNEQGRPLWQVPSPPAPGRYVQPVACLGTDVIFLPGEDNVLTARDIRTGKKLAEIGTTEVRGRQAISGIRGLSLVTKEGEHFLFVLTAHQIQVFEVTFRR